VLTAIGFNNQPRTQAGKIDDVRRYRKLPSETPAELLLS